MGSNANTPQAGAAASVMSLKEVLGIRPLRRLWMAQVISVFGDFLAMFAVFSVVSFRMHASATEISLLLVAFLLPMALFGPVAGVLVDRWNVRRTMIASDLVRAVLAALLVLATDVREIWLILFALSTISSLFIPAQSVTVRTIVPPAGLISANALMQNAVQLMLVIAPAISGALVALLSAKVCFWLDSLSFVASALLIASLTVKREAAAGKLTLAGVGRDMKAGLVFIFSHQMVTFAIVAMTVGTFAIRCFFAMIAVYVRDVLSGGSLLFGAINSLLGIGIIFGAQSIHKAARNRSKGNLVLTGLLGLGLSITLMAALGNTAATLISTLGIGVAIGFLVVPTQALLQEQTPREMLGRVSSSLMAVTSVAQVVAMCLAGPAAQQLGIRNLYFLIAGLLLMLAIAGYLRLNRPAASRARALQDQPNA